LRPWIHQQWQQMASLGWQQLRRDSQVPGIIKTIVKPTFSSKKKTLLDFLKYKQDLLPRIQNKHIFKM